jgi:predicted Zn-dependent protease
MMSPPHDVSPAENGENLFLTEAECQSIFEQCKSVAGAKYEVLVRIENTWTGSAQWARNRAYLAADVRDRHIEISLGRAGRSRRALTSSIDPAEIREATLQAVRGIEYDQGVSFDQRFETYVPKPMLEPTLWSDTTVSFDGVHRGAVVEQLIDAAEAAGVLCSGKLQVSAQCDAVFTSAGAAQYYPSTRAVFSTTVRHPQKAGSGWAGTDDFDVRRIDMQGLGARALEKCLASRNPVALEPGRYTAILEPQAVADLWRVLVDEADYWDRQKVEGNEPGPFSGPEGSHRSKIGERVIDSRITFSSDPMDPIGGFLPFSDTGYSIGKPYAAVKWIDRGVLHQLWYEYFYALSQLGLDSELMMPKSWRMSGGTTSIDEMIATTKRGVLITRLDSVRVEHRRSVTCTGYTRDGVWLIENGKISKPVKNFRFAESPLFSLNRVEQLGIPQRVFAGTRFGRNLALVAPALKVNDFNLTQLADAV